MTQAEIMQLIEDEDIEFIRLQFTDIYGRLKNIAVTPGQMGKVFQNKYCFEGTAIFDGRYEYDDKLFLYPDMDTFMILPWRPQQGKVAKIICDICDEDGVPFDKSSRYILKKTLKKSEELGYEFKVDPECEFFLFHNDENGLPTTVTHERAGYLDVGPADFGENARRDIVLMLEDMGFVIESSHHEQAPGQHEIDFQAESAMNIADTIQTFRFAVRSIAKRFGLHATFMPKPRAGVPGSGMHINLTMTKNGENAFRTAEGEIRQEAYWFMGGILRHAKAISAIANPTVNSYKRILSGYQAPSRIAWSGKGWDTYAKLKRYHDSVKLELRFPDGASNPYLLLAVCVEAGMDGIANHIDPGPDTACDKEALQASDTLPESLKEALDELNEDPVITKALGEEFTEIYTCLKYEEWKDYMKEVSDWELNRYLTRY